MDYFSSDKYVNSCEHKNPLTVLNQYIGLMISVLFFVGLILM